MNGLAGAWALGVGIVVWREVHASQHLPVPGALLGVTLLFGGLGVLASLSEQARPVIVLAAWGLDLAGLLNVLPGGLFGQIQGTAASEQAAEA